MLAMLDGQIGCELKIAISVGKMALSALGEWSPKLFQGTRARLVKACSGALRRGDHGEMENGEDTHMVASSPRAVTVNNNMIPVMMKAMISDAGPPE